MDRRRATTDGDARTLAIVAVVVLVGGVLASTGVVPREPRLGAAAEELRFAPPPFAATLAPDPDVPAVVTATGVVAPVVAVEDGYVVTTPCGATATLPVDAVTPLYGADVVLDPGHGGDEPGAVGPNGLEEADLNLAVAGLAARELTAAGLDVVLTRYGDHRMPIERRAAVSDALGAAALVSIHHNAALGLGASASPGTEVYHQVDDPASRRLAGLLWEELTATLAAYDVAWVAARGVGVSPRPGVDGDDFYGMLRRPAAAAALTEAAYLSNPSEAALLADPGVQQAQGAAIARAVRRWLETDDPGSGFVPAPFVTRTSGGGGGLDGCVDPPLS